MVQRKVPSTLYIPTDHFKTEYRVGKVRPPSPYFHDVKNKGGQVKKMKKEKSVNRLIVESSLKSPKFKKQVPQPGKPPPDEKQKQSPNYMRSTSSFEARKEKPQVSSQASVKSPKKDSRNTKGSSKLDCIPTKSLTRTSSLKKLRILTKAPSFKPIRFPNKKCSQVVLHDDFNSQRATCSSTLKDSKFPNYLDLSHGASESEGTSLMEVCPYTYCSLNGHRHAPLPPLKSFLRAKRRMAKTQKGIKLACLSPRKRETSGDLEKEVSGKVIGEKAAIQEPTPEEHNMDFYIEIYVENNGYDFKTDSGWKVNGVVDRLSNKAPSSENGVENNLGECLMKTAAESVPEEEPALKEEEVDPAKTNQEEETPETISNQCETELNGADPEICDMEYEEGQHPAENENGFESDNNFGNKPNNHDENIICIGCLEEILVDAGEDVLVQCGNDESEFINNNKHEVSILSLEYKDSSDLGDQEQTFNQPQQDEIYEDYESITNNPRIPELDIWYMDVHIGNILADTNDSATNRSPEQEMKNNESLTDMTRNIMTENGESNEVSAETCICQLGEQLKAKNLVEDPNDTDINTHQAQSFKSLDTNDIEDETHPGINKVTIANKAIPKMDAAYVGHSDSSDPKESFLAEKDEAKQQEKTLYTRGGGHSSEDMQINTINLQTIERERSKESLESEREFNPREPNYLPIIPDPEAEKVDLRHQDLDDRKNAEEWMIDYALQQTVTRLAPARKRKVALLVEAFEKVTPPRYEPSLRHSSSAFSPVRPIQACS